MCRHRNLYNDLFHHYFFKASTLNICVDCRGHSAPSTKTCNGYCNVSLQMGGNQVSVDWPSGWHTGQNAQPHFSLFLLFHSCFWGAYFISLVLNLFYVMIWMFVVLFIFVCSVNVKIVQSNFNRFKKGLEKVSYSISRFHAGFRYDWM